MATKLHINLHQGVVEVEGEEAFVRDVYKDFKEQLAKIRTSVPPPPPPHALPVDSEKEGARAPSKKAKKATGGGKGCGSYILELGDSFWSKMRLISEIRQALATKGRNYKNKHVGAALTALAKSGKLKRIDTDKGYSYEMA